MRQWLFEYRPYEGQELEGHRRFLGLAISTCMLLMIKARASESFQARLVSWNLVIVLLIVWTMTSSRGLSTGSLSLHTSSVNLIPLAFHGVPPLSDNPVVNTRVRPHEAKCETRNERISTVESEAVCKDARITVKGAQIERVEGHFIMAKKRSCKCRGIPKHGRHLHAV